MQNLNRAHIRQAFFDYTAQYDHGDPKIRLKIDHTFRVAELSDRIAAEQGADRDTAWLLGMLHDIGRFEQIRRYNTFFDAASVDHADFGAELLFREGLLDRFCRGTPEEETLWETAIRTHNRYRIPETITGRTLIHCQILRDADKLDIFRVNCETPLEDIYNVTTEELKSADVTEAVRQCFREKHAVPRALKRTPIDNLVGHLCLTYELVYPVSRRIAREQGWVERLLAFSSDNPDTAAWFRYMRENLWKNLE